MLLTLIFICNIPIYPVGKPQLRSSNQLAEGRMFNDSTGTGIQGLYFARCTMAELHPGLQEDHCFPQVSVRQNITPWNNRVIK